MRISDWSSDVCSSDLMCSMTRGPASCPSFVTWPTSSTVTFFPLARRSRSPVNSRTCATLPGDRKSVDDGRSVSVRVDHGGGSVINKKNYSITTSNINNQQRNHTYTTQNQHYIT